nr:PREDICTED: RING-H2 finger protein ATL56-like isoform X2 [Daucus carota subsp. sativus]
MPIDESNTQQLRTPPAKQTSILVALILKPMITLFILSTFLFIGIAAVSTIFFLLAVSSLHLCRRRRSHHRRRCPNIISIKELQQHLPRFSYRGGGEANRECAVCLESFETGEWCRRLVRCSHVFHVTCVDSWLAKRLNCPVCRAPVCFDDRSGTSCVVPQRQLSYDEIKLCSLVVSISGHYYCINPLHRNVFRARTM